MPRTQQPLLSKKDAPTKFIFYPWYWVFKILYSIIFDPEDIESYFFLRLVKCQMNKVSLRARRARLFLIFNVFVNTLMYIYINLKKICFT